MKEFKVEKKPKIFRPKKLKPNKSVLNSKYYKKQLKKLRRSIV